LDNRRCVGVRDGVSNWLKEKNIYRGAERRCVLQEHTTGELTGRGIPRWQEGYARPTAQHRDRRPPCQSFTLAKAEGYRNGMLQGSTDENNGVVLPADYSKMTPHWS